MATDKPTSAIDRALALGRPRIPSSLVKVTLLLSLVTSVARGDFADDQYASEPLALRRIITAAEEYGEPLRPSRDETTSYYLRNAEYVGPCEAPFGTVHVARFFYIRSSPPGSKAPARGHSFVVFADRGFHIRSVWRVESDLGNLSVSGSKLRLNNTTILDFTALPESGNVIVDGELQGVPQWK